MKKTKTCPKCGCTKLLRVKDVGGDSGISLDVGWFSSPARVTRYACTDCGYVESWVEEKHMEKVKQHYVLENS